MSSINCFLEIRKALQLFLSTLDPDTQVDMILAVPSLFDEYKEKKKYKVKEIFSYGTNNVGDPQLYLVLNEHTSAKEWPPDASPSLYKAIGVTEDGYPEWVQPVGVPDSYSKGDTVSHNDVVWRSTVDNNVWEPGVYGWEVAL